MKKIAVLVLVLVAVCTVGCAPKKPEIYTPIGQTWTAEPDDGTVKPIFINLEEPRVEMQRKAFLSTQTTEPLKEECLLLDESEATELQGVLAACQWQAYDGSAHNTDVLADADGRVAGQERTWYELDLEHGNVMKEFPDGSEQPEAVFCVLDEGARETLLALVLKKLTA